MIQNIRETEDYKKLLNEFKSGKTIYIYYFTFRLLEKMNLDVELGRISLVNKFGLERLITAKKALKILVKCAKYEISERKLASKREALYNNNKIELGEL